MREHIGDAWTKGAHLCLLLKKTFPLQLEINIHIPLTQLAFTNNVRKRCRDEVVPRSPPYMTKNLRDKE